MKQVPNTWEDEKKLKKGLKTVVILLLLPLVLLLVPASHAQSTVTTVTIHGSVSNPVIGPVTVRADASGSASSLVGAGSDNPPFPFTPPGANPGVCQFPLTGSILGSTVTLSGTVTQASISAFIGTPVGFSANAATGAITFTFGPFTFTGTGTVVITTA